MDKKEQLINEMIAAHKEKGKVTKRDLENIKMYAEAICDRFVIVYTKKKKEELEWIYVPMKVVSVQVLNRTEGKSVILYCSSNRISEVWDCSVAYNIPLESARKWADDPVLIIGRTVEIACHGVRDYSSIPDHKTLLHPKFIRELD